MEGVNTGLLECLARGWRLLRLSVDAPQRVTGWDWIVITAANDKQARIYQRQLEQARHRGLIPEATRTCAVPDPAGKRIGSGGATLNALRQLKSLESAPLADRAILLIHAGGDSKRLPWASVPGKLFVPFPLQADPDHAVPTLFDHLLALAAPLAARADRRGILLSLTGDVLPLFDADAIHAPDNGALVVTTPASLDVAERHGVIVPDNGAAVTRLLQKPNLDTMLEANALTGGAARIDTGIYLFGGTAVEALASASVAPDDPLKTLLASDRECSLYEEIAWAMVPTHHKQLADHPIGGTLLGSLRSVRLHHHNTEQFAFIHLGASAEYLAHLAGHWYGQMPHRILAECSEGASPAGYCYAAQIPAGAQSGYGTAAIGATLSPGVRIGNRCLTTDFDAGDEPLKLPDNCCLWQLPVMLKDGQPRLATLCCGVDDNPKEELQSATFCNRSLHQWIQRHGVTETELWPDDDTPRTLWTARLFPALLDDAGLASLRWILRQKPDQPPPLQWRDNPRLAMADLQQLLDLDRLFKRREHLRTRLLLHALREAVAGAADRNIAALAKQLPTEEIRNRAASLIPDQPVLESERAPVPESRQWQIRSDLLGAGSQTERAEHHAQQATAAVSREVAAAMDAGQNAPPVANLQPGTTEHVELPVRFDLAGGWSDTPPYCLERPAGVLNLAMSLNGENPVTVEVEALDTPEWRLQLGDSGQQITIPNTPEATAPSTLQDPFILLKTALALTGYGSPEGISQGVRLHSSARVPKGSGLGTSSILGAAVVSALQKLAQRPADPETVSDRVLNLEQRMSTGGGWQDQLGGLHPGVKFISSVPVRPLKLRTEPVPLLPATVRELHDRFVVAFSGQERLAKNVLQIVVGRYLRRDHRMIEAVEGLVELAREGRQLLSMGKLDQLGTLLREVWALHQQLDPHCSNPAVDAIFRSVDDLASGYKLAGAGGGGFMGILAKDPDAAQAIRNRLREHGHGLHVYDWTLHERN